MLRTPRLILRTYRPDDLPLYAEVNADPEVMRYLGGIPLTRAESDDIAAWAQQRYAREAFGLLAVERQADGRFLGMCGLHRPQWYPDELEIGWRLAREHWGHGFATEAGAEWLGYAFTALGVPRVISIADVPNTRSIAVMTRLGMTFEHEARLEEDGVEFDATVYAITARQWHAREH